MSVVMWRTQSSWRWQQSRWRKPCRMSAHAWLRLTPLSTPAAQVSELSDNCSLHVLEYDELRDQVPSDGACHSGKEKKLTSCCW